MSENTNEATTERPTCSMADDNCGGAPVYEDGKCYWHFMHTDRDPKHLATLEDAGQSKTTEAPAPTASTSEATATETKPAAKKTTKKAASK